MQIKTETLSDTDTILHLTGRMDVESSPAARQAILDLAENGVMALVVHLGQVEFMDSSGLSALVSGIKALRRGGGMLAICAANAQVRTALRLTMLDRVFPTHNSPEDAFDWMKTQGSESVVLP